MDQVDSWFMSRWGKFTGSEINRLLTPGKGEMFSSGGWTYITERAVQRMTVMQEKPQLDSVKSLIWGRSNEEAAFNEYRNVTRNFGVKYCGTCEPVFLEYNDYSGASPDGIDCDDSGNVVNIVLELKSPLNSSVHFDYLRMKDQYELKDYSIQYYAQVQFLLMITNCRCAHWASYDNRFKDRSKRLKIIEIVPDKKFQDNLEIRLMQANKECEKLIQSLSQ